MVRKVVFLVAHCLPIALAAVCAACGGAASAAHDGSAGDSSVRDGSTGDGAVHDSGERDGAARDAASPPDADPPVPHHVVPCNQVTSTGAWENITPAGIDLTIRGIDNYGVTSMLLDPQNAATVYVGTSSQNIYKSNDCGASWTIVNTGRNGAVIGSGRQWSFVIDPQDPQILYANSGYATLGGWGAWKSTNGGVDWDPLLDTAHQAIMGFVHLISIDPTNHLHLIVSPHFTCAVGAYNGMPTSENCLLETQDGGATWDIRENTPSDGEGGGHFMVNANTWFWPGNVLGMWRTGDGGQSWQKTNVDGYALPSWLIFASGNILVAGVSSLLQSTNGDLNWTALPGSPGTDVVTGDENEVFVGQHNVFSRADTSDLTHWTALPSVPVSDPARLACWFMSWDPDHRILYSVHNNGGLWRLVLPPR